MLRFIRDLVFPKAYDFSDRGRARRSTEASSLTRREVAEPASSGQPERPASVSAEA